MNTRIESKDDDESITIMMLEVRLGEIARERDFYRKTLREFIEMGEREDAPVKPGDETGNEIRKWACLRNVRRSREALRELITLIEYQDRMDAIERDGEPSAG